MASNAAMAMYQRSRSTWHVAQCEVALDEHEHEQGSTRRKCRARVNYEKNADEARDKCGRATGAERVVRRSAWHSSQCYDAHGWRVMQHIHIAILNISMSTLIVKRKTQVQGEWEWKWYMVLE
jgi:hypothetical protein